MAAVAVAVSVEKVARPRVEAGHLVPILRNAGWLLVETILLPTVLLLVWMHAGHPMVGLWVVLGWRLGAVAVRQGRSRRVPATVLLSVAMFTFRTVISVAFGSVYMFLLQPILVTAALSAAFTVSAWWSTPLPMRLAADFVRLPDSLVGDGRVRSMFAQVALLWGVLHLVTCGLGFVGLQYGSVAGVLSGGALSIVSTLGGVALCAGWGLRCLRRIPGAAAIRIGAPGREVAVPLRDHPRVAGPVAEPAVGVGLVGSAAA